MARTSFVTALGVCALFGALWVWQTREEMPSGVVTVVKNIDSVTTEERIGKNPSATSPFSVSDSSSSSAQISPASLEGVIDTESGELINLDTQNNPLTDAIDVTSLGRSTISDSEFLQIAEVLRRDPTLLQQLIDEFRQETDVARRAALSRLLGEVGGDSVTLAASELIYSGDAESRQAGLELLQQVQPGNDAARGIASSLLASEVEPDILVGTLTTLARPGNVDDNSRQFLSAQVAYLADHEDASVRSISLDILSRWSKDGQYTEVLRNGLYDQESVVRESAAYALVGHDNISPSLIESLLSVALNSSEDKRARSGAILALQGMPIDSVVKQQVAAAQLELNTIRR